jgi:hypothetical protein
LRWVYQWKSHCLRCFVTEYLEEIELDTADHKRAKWLRYFYDTSMVWPHGPARLQQLLRRLSSLRSAIKFTMEVEANYILPLLDILVIKRGPKLGTKLHRKSNHTGRYLRSKFSHAHHVKMGLHSLISRAKVKCQNQKDFNKEIMNKRHDVMLNEYPQEFVDSVISHQGTAILLQTQYVNIRAYSLSLILMVYPRT